MEMPLQIALFLAAIAVILFVACCIPAIFQMRRHAAGMAQALQELKVEVSVLVRDSQQLVRSVNELSTRANRQFDDVERIVRTVRGWSERADLVVGEVGSIVEPSIMTAVRNVQIVRKGIAKFFETFFNRNHQPQKAEESHVTE